jgi:mannose-1-phosphate guanylyltransferase
MQALILAGGLGTRLQSIVNDRPKPMADISNKPFLEHQLEFLRSFQIRELIFCVGHLHQHIQAYFGDGSRWGVQIHYSIEETLLGTGGAVKLAEPYIKGTFLTLNGDSFFDINLDGLLRFHKDSIGAGGQGGKGEKKESLPCSPAPPLRCSYLGTIALTEVHDAGNYGSVSLDKEHRILNFVEKSASPLEGIFDLNGSAQPINAGIYVLEPDIFRFIPPDRKVSLERETFPAILQGGYTLGGYPARGFFVDIGTPAGYYQFQHHLKESIKN